jgi:GTP-binding protein LepA
MNQDHIRNFAIIAHIDHGKSTLADRLLEITGTVAKRDMEAQILDSNPIERERGITIKLAPVRMKWKEYILNLIDTPGHVDFGYEVSRSLAACEGAVLVVDATQGVQAQTLANLHQARMHKLKIIPLVNKIDMPNARIAETEDELVGLGFTKAEIIRISAKTGENVDLVLQAIVERVPPPHGEPDKPLRALIFSSQYDTHKGVVVFVRVFDGRINFVNSNNNSKPQDNPDQTIESAPRTTSRLKFMISGAEVTPIEAGFFMPSMKESPGIATGEVGYIATGLKDVRFAKVGDTVTVGKIPNASVQPPQASEPLPGYKEPKPMVFLSLFPLNSDEFTLARESLDKLRLSDSAFTFRPISSTALGNGFHCGFLGLLHAEIVQERLSREFNLNMIATSPSVEYHVTLARGMQFSKLGLTISSVISETEANTEVRIESAAELPDPSFVAGIKEPVMNVIIFTPKRYVGPIMQLAQEKRGEYIDLKYTAGEQAEFTYLIPLSEMIVDFFDRLKSITEGYASLDYEFFDYQTVDVVKIDILLNHEKVDALSFLAVQEQAVRHAKEIVEKLAKVIPRQQFSIPVQGAIGGQVIARDDIKPFRKDVIAHLYGGDRTRKDKLLDKQKKGKAKMKLIGRVEIPQSAFFEVLKRE